MAVEFRTRRDYNAEFLARLEGDHQRGIDYLAEIFGLPRQEVEAVYAVERAEIESIATIFEHVPFFTGRAALKSLRATLGREPDYGFAGPEYAKPKPVSAPPEQDGFRSALFRAFSIYI